MKKIEKELIRTKFARIVAEYRLGHALRTPIRNIRDSIDEEANDYISALDMRCVRDLGQDSLATWEASKEKLKLLIAVTRLRPFSTMPRELSESIQSQANDYLEAFAYDFDIHNDENEAVADAVKPSLLLALEMTREQKLRMISALAFLMADNTSGHHEVLDWGLLDIPNEVIDLCLQLSEKHKLQVIKRLAFHLVQS